MCIFSAGCVRLCLSSVFIFFNLSVSLCLFDGPVGQNIHFNWAHASQMLNDIFVLSYHQYELLTNLLLCCGLSVQFHLFSLLVYFFRFCNAAPNKLKERNYENVLNLFKHCVAPISLFYCFKKMS